MITTNEIVGKLSKIFEEVLEQSVPKELFEEDEDLAELYHIDSLVALKIIVKIEQEFSVLIEDDEEAIRMIQSPKEALRYLSENKLS